MEALRSLEIAIRAMAAQQEALHVIGHNIANVNTPGYSRQRAILTTTRPAGSVGTGVKVGMVERVRDEIVDFHIRGETSTLHQWMAKNKVLGELEILFNEPSGAGLSAIMSKFWDSWADFVNNPESGSTRVNLREQTKTLCESFNQLHSTLQNHRSSMDKEIQAEVERLNDITQQIAQLNEQIEKIELGGKDTANDLRDRRDILLDRLSGLINCSYREMDDGTVRISLFGQFMVSKTQVALLTTEAGESGYLDIKWVDSGEEVTITNGKLKGLLDARDTVIPEFLQRLDNLASTLISEVNSLHRAGMGLDGASDIAGWKDFTGTLDANGSFDINGVTISVSSGDALGDIINAINLMTDDAGTPTGVVASLSADGKRLILQPGGTSPQTIDITADPDDIMLEKLGILSNFFKGDGADDIAISDAIASDVNMIAASQSGAPGDNSNALAICQLQSSLTMENDTSTFSDYYNGIIGKLGIEKERAANLEGNARLFLTQLENRRQSISGVSLDEEMTNIIIFQQAYQVAVNFLQTVSEMLDILTTTLK